MKSSVTAQTTVHICYNCSHCLPEHWHYETQVPATCFFGVKRVTAVDYVTGKEYSYVNRDEEVCRRKNTNGKCPDYAEGHTMTVGEKP